jgi:hypothetical protein
MRVAAHFNQTKMIRLFFIDWASIQRPVALIKLHELEAAFRESLHQLMRSHPCVYYCPTTSKKYNQPAERSTR